MVGQASGRTALSPSAAAAVDLYEQGLLPLAALGAQVAAAVEAGRRVRAGAGAGAASGDEAETTWEPRWAVAAREAAAALAAVALR